MFFVGFLSPLVSGGGFFSLNAGSLLTTFMFVLQLLI